MIVCAPQWLCFGKYVYLNTKDPFPNLYPLVECLIHAINDDQSLDTFLPFLFTDEAQQGGCGPHWNWWRKKQEDDSYLYHVWTDQKVSELILYEAVYDEETMKHHVRRTLNHFRKINPKRSADVDEVVAKYAL
jgi:hypothetical protein